MERAVLIVGRAFPSSPNSSAHVQSIRVLHLDPVVALRKNGAVRAPVPAGRLGVLLGFPDS